MPGNKLKTNKNQMIKVTLYKHKRKKIKEIKIKN